MEPSFWIEGKGRSALCIAGSLNLADSRVHNILTEGPSCEEAAPFLWHATHQLEALCWGAWIR